MFTRGYDSPYQPSYMVTSLYGQIASASWLHPHLAHINHFFAKCQHVRHPSLKIEIHQKTV